MSQQANLRVIVGLGKTGMSCARFLAARNIPFAVMDTRDEPPYLQSLRSECPSVPVKVGGLDAACLRSAEEIIVSPGLSLAEPSLAASIAAGIPVIGDIELFARFVKAPVCAITGSNAKSTVTSLVAQMAGAAGLNVRMGGNIGIPALDLIQANEPDLYVLELSSFQLELTSSLQPVAATILNISADHMDRYASLEDYTAAKQRVYHQTENIVINRDDALTWPQNAQARHRVSFGSSRPEADEFGLIASDARVYLAYGREKLLGVDELRLKGRHNWMNALAALALGQALKLPMAPMLETLRTFAGLSHRCQWAGERNGVSWYNDSKGTNVGATVAAIEGLGEAISGKIILIAGGVGKGADFTLLLPAVQKYAAKVILLGTDAEKIARVIQGAIPFSYAEHMFDAVSQAQLCSQPGDSVLLSPACASFDMFKNFEDRGDVFMRAVKEIVL